MNLIESLSAEAESASKSALLLPLGSLEQHGTEAPLGCDGIIAEEICRRAGSMAGCAVLPTLYYGNSHCHTAFPGTFSLSLETYSSLLREMISEADRNGFDRLIMLSGHGGNRKAAERAITKSRNTGSAEYLGYWELPGAMKEEERLFGRTGHHITVSEVSMVWHILGRPVPGLFRGKYPDAGEGMGKLTPAEWRKAYPDGGIGADMNRVSIDRGRMLLDWLVGKLAERLTGMKH